MNRPQLTDGQINFTIEKIRVKLNSRLRQKGYGTFSSVHEILGMATEEYNELVNAIHNKDYENIEDELLDLAVGCAFGYACLDARTIDW